MAALRHPEGAHPQTMPSVANAPWASQETADVTASDSPAAASRPRNCLFLCQARLQPYGGTGSAVRHRLSVVVSIALTTTPPRQVSVNAVTLRVGRLGDVVDLEAPL